MDEYSVDENSLKPSSQTSVNSKKGKKVRRQKSNNDNLSKSEQPITKIKKKVKKVLNRQTSTDKTSELTSEPPAIDITSSMNTDQNSISKFNGHRPQSIEKSNSNSCQINDSDLNTESAFSSSISQKLPEKMTKQMFDESRTKAIQSIKQIDSNETLSGGIDLDISINSEEYSSYASENGQKSKSRSKGKKKINRNLSSHNSRNSSNRKSNSSVDSTNDNISNQIPKGSLNRQPRRRFFDRDDDQNIKPRNIKVNDEDSSINFGSSSLLSTNTDMSEINESDISQTPLPNEESFKKMRNNAILSIKATNPHEKSETASLSEDIPSEFDTTSANPITDSNLSQVQKSDFEKPISKAINEIKEVSLNEDDETSSTFESSLTDLTDQNKKDILIDKTIENVQSFENNTKSLSEQNSKTKSNQEIKIPEEEEEEEEEAEDAGNDTLTHSQLNQTVDMSDISDQIENEQLNSSGQYFNSDITDDQALREVKTKVDDLVIPESTKAYMNRGIRIRPKEDNTEAVFATLTLPENNNLQFDSEISELDVEFNTDKKKFKKSIVSKTPTNRIPSSVQSGDRRRVKKNNYEDNLKSRNTFNEPSNIEYSGFQSFISSEPSEITMSRDINLDDTSLIQEDSLMFPTKFEVQQANSDDDGSLFETFKRNVNFLSSTSSDDQTPPPTPIQTRSTPNNSVTEVVETTYTEIDSISGSSSNSKRHKDKTVTKGRIVLYDLSSSSSFDELDEDLNLDVQERGIKNEFSIDNIKTDDNNNNKQRSEKLTSKPVSYDKSSKTQNCYFDGNVVLKLTVVEAINLPQEEFTPLDPYCTVALSDKKKIQRTKTIRSTTKPIWDQQFLFNYNIHKLTNRTNPPSTPTFQRITKQNGIYLYVNVINEDKFGGDREIASAQLDLKDIKLSQYIDQWVKLRPSGNSRTGGEIHLNLFVEPQTPISSISPRKVKINNNNDDSDYLVSPRSQTPNAHVNPFAETAPKRQTTNRAHFNTNKRGQQKSEQKPTKSQTPNFNYSQRPWTDSSSSEVSAIEQDQNNQNDTVTLTLADQVEEEEELQYTYEEIEEEEEEEDEQNDFHTEIKPGGRKRRTSKSNSENVVVDDKIAVDQELLNNHDDSEDLSPIEKTAREDDEDGNSLNLNSLPTGDMKRRNINIQEEEEANDYDYNGDDESPPINLDEDEEEDDSNVQTMSSISSGNVDENIEYGSI